jgi:hypothetical protein
MRERLLTKDYRPRGQEQRKVKSARYCGSERLLTLQIGGLAPNTRQLPETAHILRTTAAENTLTLGIAKCHKANNGTHLRCSAGSEKVRQWMGVRGVCSGPG